MPAVLPYQRPHRGRTVDRILVSVALFTVVIIGPAAVGYTEGRTHGPATATAHAATPAKRPTWGPHGTAFGLLPSSGDSVVDCGEMADHTNDLPDAAVEVVERCLDLHGWTYDR